MPSTVRFGGTKSNKFMDEDKISFWDLVPASKTKTPMCPVSN